MTDITAEAAALRAYIAENIRFGDMPGTFCYDPMGYLEQVQPDRIRRLLDALDEAQKDAARLDWVQRQYLEELSLGLVVDAPHDGRYFVNGDSGKTRYGKTLREAIDLAMKD